MKHLIRILLLIELMIACNRKIDRNHLNFIDPLEDIEKNMQQIDKILPNLPPQEDSLKIQSYFYDIIDGDTVLYINAKKIGMIHSKSTKTKLDSVFENNRIASDFISSSRLLARNNLSHCLKENCGWVYVYKYSDDRDAFRAVIFNYPGLAGHLERSCYLIPIDRKGNIILFKREIITNNLSDSTRVNK